MIFWELILKTDKVCDRLQLLYTDFGGVKALSGYLGVSRQSLLKKLKECGIERRGPGGPHLRVPREILPDKWWTMDTETLTRLTGYSPNYIRTLRRVHRCELEASIKEKKQSPPTGSKDSQ